MAKRVNKNFLLPALVVGGVVMLAVGGIGARLLFTHSTSYYVSQGDALLAEGRFYEASQKYERALGKDMGNKELALKLGDTYQHLVGQDPGVYIPKTHAAWGRALELDPAYGPALQRELDSYVEQFRLMGYFGLSNELYFRIRDISQKSVRAD